MMSDSNIIKELLANDAHNLLDVKPSSSGIKHHHHNLINNFEDITKFVDMYGREPEKSNGIFEKQLFLRLRSVRKNEGWSMALKEIDRHKLLNNE